MKPRIYKYNCLYGWDKKYWAIHYSEIYDRILCHYFQEVDIKNWCFDQSKPIVIVDSLWLGKIKETGPWLFHPHIKHNNSSFYYDLTEMY